MSENRNFLVYTDENGVDIFHKSFARTHMMNTFNLMREWGDISEHDFDEINKMLNGSEPDQELAYAMIELRVKEKYELNI